MAWKEERILEEQILQLLDQIIDEASQVSMMVGPYREERFREGVRTMEQLAALCELLVEGRKDYVEPTLRQLMQQKLPHPAVMRSFGEFQSVLEEYVRAGMEMRKAVWESGESKDGEDVPQEHLNAEQQVLNEVLPTLNDFEACAVEDIETNDICPGNDIFSKERIGSIDQEEPGESIIIRTLRDLYPSFKIIAGGPEGTTGIEAYVPEKKIAFVCGYAPKAAGRREFVCRQLGFKLVYISREDLHSPSRLKRGILRAGIR